VAEKYDYRYGPDELAAIGRQVRAFATHARRVAVTFNNNNEDYPVQNALDLMRLLGLEPPALDPRPARRPRDGDLFAEPDPDAGHPR
jgi:uncharacterized protein YecE (DUF72 family)